MAVPTLSQLTLFLLLLSPFIPLTSAIAPLEQPNQYLNDYASMAPPDLNQAVHELPPTAPPNPSQDVPDSSSTSNAVNGAFLAPILGNLGFQELAMAVPTLSESSLTRLVGPATVFAPTDDSIRTCPTCSVASLLREHIVPGIFSLRYLNKLAFGTKLETISPARCITVTSTISAVDNATRVFIDGVEITRPDLFNDGRIVIHGIQGFLSPLPPFSCGKERPPVSVTSSSIPRPSAPSPIMRLMLQDAMLRLRESGYSVLSLALRVKHAELSNLQNMTIFALDDDSIFTGGHAYVTNVRFHIVPNQYLTHADLMHLPMRTTLPTLVHGQALVLTSTGMGLRINYVPLRAPDVLYNLKIVVHGIFMPFPHLHFSAYGMPEMAAFDSGIFDTPVHLSGTSVVGSCRASGHAEPMTSPAKPPTAATKDDMLQHSRD